MPVRPAIVFGMLRLLMFALSFVLEDWAILELVSSPRRRQQALLLVASSYVTWTWQVHTFSNASETLVVLWSLVLIRRLRASNVKEAHHSLWTSAVLAFLLVFGTFNRITFPAFVLIPFLMVVQSLWKKPSRLITFGASAALTGLAAVLADTEFYSATNPSFLDAVRNPIITPWNNLRYNSSSENLAQHGTHPRYQHFLANLPQLLGPALFLLLYQGYDLRQHWKDTPLEAQSALSGTMILSIFPHQEARFLMPAIPLLLSTLHVPAGRRLLRILGATWVVFNLALGVLMGGYHQAGIYPAQMWIGEQPKNVIPADTHVFWWKTYSPPRWLLDGRGSELATIDLMGLAQDQLEDRLCGTKASKLLVAPSSAVYLDRLGKEGASNGASRLRLEEALWTTRRHLNLDDMDFGDDGVSSTASALFLSTPFNPQYGGLGGFRWAKLDTDSSVCCMRSNNQAENRDASVQQLHPLSSLPFYELFRLH